MYAGQDGHYNLPSRSYSNSGSMTITDETTGLVWYEETSPTAIDRDGAAEFCASLEGEWRVPKRHELQTLVDYSGANTSGWFIDDRFDMPDAAAQIAVFWTNTGPKSKPNNLWAINFKTGEAVQVNTAGTTAWVRCVWE